MANARDAMLDDLDRLRRDLEVQRVNQTTSLMNPADSDKMQVSATEIAIKDLRQNVEAQQACLAELRKEFSTQKCFSDQCVATLELALRRTCEDVSTLRDESKKLKLQLEEQLAHVSQRARVAAEEALASQRATFENEFQSHLQTPQKDSAGHPQLGGPAATESSSDVWKEITAIRQSMSARASATDRKMSELTVLTQEIVSELGILRGRFQAIGDRPDLVAQIVASGRAAEGAAQEKGERRGRPASQASSDSDVSALRPRSESGERSASGARPHSTFRQFAADSSQLLRSVEVASAYPDGDGILGNDVPAAPIGGLGNLDAGSQFAGPRDDPLWRPRHGLAPVLDVITEARPSLETCTHASTSARPSMGRPSTQGPTSARPSMDFAER